MSWCRTAVCPDQVGKLVLIEAPVYSRMDDVMTDPSFTFNQFVDMVKGNMPQYFLLLGHLLLHECPVPCAC